MHLAFHEFDLPLRHVFTISRGSHEVYRTLIVELEQDGVSGYGEAGESDFYGATVANMTAAPGAGAAAARSGTAGRPGASCGTAAPGAWRQHASPSARSTWPPTTSGASCAASRSGSSGARRSTNLPPHRLHDRHRHDRHDGRARWRSSPAGRSTRSSSARRTTCEIVRELRQHTDAVFRVDANCALDRRGDDPQRRGAQAAGRRVHRAAAAAGATGRRCGGSIASRPCR